MTIKKADSGSGGNGDKLQVRQVVVEEIEEKTGKRGPYWRVKASGKWYFCFSETLANRLDEQAGSPISVNIKVGKDNQGRDSYTIDSFAAAGAGVASDDRQTAIVTQSVQKAVAPIVAALAVRDSLPLDEVKTLFAELTTFGVDFVFTGGKVDEAEAEVAGETGDDDIPF